MVVVSFGVDTWLRRRMGCAFLYRKEQARNVPISAMVVHRRLQDGRVHDDWKNGQRGFARDAEELAFGTLYFALRASYLPSTKL